MAETNEKKGLGDMLGQAGTTVKDGVVGSLKGTRAVFSHLLVKPDVRRLSDAGA